MADLSTLFRDAVGLNFLLEWQHKLPKSWRADLEAQGEQWQQACSPAREMTAVTFMTGCISAAKQSCIQQSEQHNKHDSWTRSAALSSMWCTSAADR